MPRTGDTYNLPAGGAVAGTEANAVDVTVPIADLAAEQNLVRPIAHGGTGASTAPGARDALEIDAKVLAKSSTYTALAGDRSKLLRFTATATLNLTAAATLGDGWFIDILADGGDVTVDPNSSETVDGSATLVVSDGSSTRVRCNGTAFYSQFMSTSAGISAVVDDTSPQLGGDLDANGHAIFTAKGADVASATELLVLTDGNVFDVTGTTTITSIETSADAFDVGSLIVLQFDGALTLTHHSTNLVLPKGENITTAAGDIAVLSKYAAGDWRLVSYQRAAGVAVADLADGTDGQLITWDSSGAPDTVAAGSSGQVLTSNGAGAAPTFEDQGGSVVLAAKTATNDASLDFTEFVNATYSYYTFTPLNVTPATDGASLYFRTSTNAVDYDSGVTDYEWSRTINGTNGTDTGDAQLALAANVGNDTAEDGVSGEVKLFNPGAAKTTGVTFLGQHTSSTGAPTLVTFAGARLAQEDVTAVQFFFASGNIASGTIIMRGYTA